MTIFSWLNQITPEQYSVVGRKAFTLSQIKRAGYPVTPGLVITCTTLEELFSVPLSEKITSFPYLDFNNSQALQTFARESRQQILEANFPDQWLSTILNSVEQLSTSVVCLRPSLSLLDSQFEDWDEMLSTQFCLCEASALAMAIKKTWAELFRAKSLFWIQKHNLDLKKVRLAILVQSGDRVIASGITQINSSCLNIQATWGFELALHQGEILPDFYRINLFNRQVETQELGNKIIAYHPHNSPEGLKRNLLDKEALKNYVLTESHLQQLIDLSLSLKADYPTLESFNWTLSEGNQLYLTSLKPYFTKQITPPHSGLILTGLAAASGKAIAPAQVINPDQTNWESIPPRHILVLNSFNLDWLPQLKQASGLIIETGGLTSHGAIIARELRIPAIVSAREATTVIKTGEFLKIDGDTGEIHSASSADTEPPPDLETFTPTYPIGTQLLVNISQVETIAQVAHLPIDGVGLLRSEFFFLEQLQNRSLITWLSQYKSELLAKLLALLEPVSRALNPKPVFYRSLNWYALELQSYLKQFQSETQLKRDLFSLELQAILSLRKEQNYNINLLLPFIRSVPEFKNYHQQAANLGLLQEQSFQIWIMAEIPSIIFLLPEYVTAGVQGISIGTNDLSQFILGINREESFIPPELNPKHPALKKAIKQLIELAKQANIPCSICGQAPVDYPEMIVDLVRWGIKSISVEPKAVKQTYQAIARAEQSILLDLGRNNFS